MLKLCKIYACPNGTLGLHLSRAPWDPYPWVSGVQDGSNAYQAGVRSGDTVLELNGCDVLGQKILELANRIQNHWDQGGSFVSLLVWRNKTENNAINQQSLQKFAKCLQQVAQLLECPVCLEVVKPPGWQCCNGHVLCNSCRGRTVKCPICRVTLGPRGRCLLSDKLFTLLAESFPCDGVKNGNSSLERQKTYNNCHVGLPLISPKIDASSSPAQQKIHQKNQIVGRKISENITKSTGAKHPVFDDDNKVVLKLNQKSKKSHDFVEHGSCHHVHYHNHHSHLHRQASNSHQYKRQQLVHQGTFYCPTGKSSCSVMQDNVSTIVSTASIAISASNNLRSDPDSRTTDCVWTQDVGRKPKGVDGNRIDSVGVKLITEWDMLTHLTQIHKISVAQHYATFGQVVRLRLQVPHAKSIPCITIQSERTSTWDKENLRNHVILPDSTCSNTRTVCDGNREECVSTFFCNESSTERVQGHDLEKKCKNSRTTNTPKNIHRSSGQLFFVACIPLEDEATTAETETIRENEDEMEKERLRNEMNDMNADTRGDVRIVSTPCLQPKFDDCRAVVGAAIADTNTNTKARALPVFAVETPNGPSTEVIKRATISKSTRQSTHSQTTGHFIRDLRSKFVSSTFLQQSRVNVENSANNPSDCTYCPKVDGSTSTWCNSSTSVMSSSSSSVSSSSTPSSSSSSCSSLSCSFSSSSSLPSLSRSWSIASLSVSNSSYGRCSNTLTQQHAIFIWYFGSEFDVKNFQTVIECKRTGLKWTGCVHPLTKSWSSIRQGLQQQIQLHLKQQTIDEQQHIQEQFLVVNSMPDGGDNFFDIAIKIK